MDEQLANRLFPFVQLDIQLSMLPSFAKISIACQFNTFYSDSALDRTTSWSFFLLDF